MKLEFAPSLPILLCAGVVVSQLACSGPSPRTDNRPPAAVSVQVFQVRLAPFEDFYDYAGTVRAQERAVIASKVAGTILDVPAKPGDVVRAGQLLIRIESDELSAEVTRAEAAAAAAEKAVAGAEKALDAAAADAHLASLTYRRYQELLAKRSISPQEFDQADARRRSAEAAQEMASARIQEARAQREQAAAMLEAARIRKGYARINAPFEGIVTEKQADPGTLAVAGMPLLTLEKTAAYRLEASVPESRMTRVKIGASVKITIPAIQLEATGRVVEIEPLADVTSRTFLVKISLPEASRVRSGMYGRALFSQAGMNALAVPSQCVVRNGQLSSVFVVSEGVVRQRLVTLGRAAGNTVEVLSGLSEGDRVATSRVGTLVDGSPVEIR